MAPEMIGLLGIIVLMILLALKMWVGAAMTLVSVKTPQRIARTARTALDRRNLMPSPVPGKGSGSSEGYASPTFPVKYRSSSSAPAIASPSSKSRMTAVQTNEEISWDSIFPGDAATPIA